MPLVWVSSQLWIRAGILTSQTQTDNLNEDSAVKGGFNDIQQPKNTVDVGQKSSRHCKSWGINSTGVVSLQDCPLKQQPGCHIKTTYGQTYRITIF